MSAVFGFSREAVRVKVKVRIFNLLQCNACHMYHLLIYFFFMQKCEGSLPPELRKFSVDPQITSFEVLQSILAKAFDLKGEFTICYRVEDVNNREIYLPLLSDWDLDAAFLKCVKIIIEISRRIQLCLYKYFRAHNSSTNNTEPCLCLQVDLKSFEECSDEWDPRTTVPMITQFKSVGQEAKSAPRLHGIFNQVRFLIQLH